MSPVQQLRLAGPVWQAGMATIPLLCLDYTQHSTGQDALKICMLKKMTGEDVVPR